MGLPWRFISASAGMVTLVMGTAVEEDRPPGKLVRLIVLQCRSGNSGCDPYESEYTPPGAIRCEGVHADVVWGELQGGTKTTRILWELMQPPRKHLRLCICTRVTGLGSPPS